MKIRFAVITIALALSASGAKGDASKAAVCVACHGVDGNSINPIWPNLAGQGAEYTVQQLNAFKTKKRNNAVMWPFASNLTEEDMWDLAIYYSKQKISISPTKTATSEDAAKLYRGGDQERLIPACTACHGPNGAGNGPAKYPSLRGQHAAYTELQLRAYRKGSRKHPMMQAIAQKLSDEDIKVLSSYISALY